MGKLDVNNENGPFVLSLEGLQVSYAKDRTLIRAVDGLSLTLLKGQTLCLVGESGSGKTSLALAIPRLLPLTAVVQGKLEFLGLNVLTMPREHLYELRRRKVSVIFQDAVGSLVPGTRVGTQLARALKYRLGISGRDDLIKKSRALLDAVGLDDRERVLSCYPHELSGGMCQRVMIALALSAQPALLLADEPLSSLDAISQVRILDLLFNLQKQHGFAMLYVTHDLRVASRFDNLGVLRHGRLVEYGPTRNLLRAPAADYTKELLNAVSALGTLEMRTGQ